MHVHVMQSDGSRGGTLVAALTRAPRERVSGGGRLTCGLDGVSR